MSAVSPNSRESKQELLLLLEERKRRQQAGTVVGIVHPIDGHTHSVVRRGSKWQLTTEEPQVYLPSKLEAVLRSDKRFIIVIGGRGSGKSVGVADICLIDAKDNNAKTYCLREYQSSIRNSIHSLLKEEISRLEFTGFEVQDNGIKRSGEDAFQFAGLARNPDSIKSAHGFKRYQVEEAQFISSGSLKALTPTARKRPMKGKPTELEEVIDDPSSRVSIVFIGNPGSSEDPFSKRFIAPFKEHLDRDGRYEDDLHLIVVMNYEDNPWFHLSGLEEERQWDYENLDRALYDHIWLGAFNDSVEHALIKAEWFDACVDAHKKLGFAPTGARIGSHDPSDLGPDSKGFAVRHGSVLIDLQEKLDGNVNEGGHWAAGEAIKSQVDSFSWDGDGMGIALTEQFSKDFEGKPTILSVFRGSESPDYPDAVYAPAMASPVAQQKTNRDVFRNKRAQYYFELRDRAYRTYRAVELGEYHDPARLISFDSSIDILHRLRAELCRMPIKPNGNGLFELYTKEEMKSKFKMASPNLADSVMILMRHVAVSRPKAVIPKPIRPMGRR
ncbi:MULTISPECIES: phage terminase large subunit [unclassified Pseudomonas]|uniref:phage terminase large subunit n=1 Tax=unclassified Pseudomonas TaxID=196821 RepID=UPI0015A1465F|nr:MULTISPECIES: phage terminase large subunit [unclassified Pseudomonas]